MRSNLQVNELDHCPSARDQQRLDLKKVVRRPGTFRSSRALPELRTALHERKLASGTHGQLTREVVVEEFQRQVLWQLWLEVDIGLYQALRLDIPNLNNLQFEESDHFKVDPSRWFCPLTSVSPSPYQWCTPSFLGPG